MGLRSPWSAYGLMKDEVEESVKKNAFRVVLAACILTAGGFSVYAAEIELGPWHTSGPLPSTGFDQALFPETAVDLSAESPDGVPLWTEQPDWADGKVHVLSGGNSVATYLYRAIRAQQPCTVPVEFGSDDGIAVWLNGAEVLSNNVARGLGAGQDKLELSLAPGENSLLVKVFNITGGHGFYFAIDNAGARDGWPGLDAALMKEMEALQKAGVPPGDERWAAVQAKANEVRGRLGRLQTLNLPAVRLAIQDLSRKFPDRYVQGPEFLKRIELLEEKAKAGASGGLADEVEALRREALLANPLLDFQRMLVIKRSEKQLGLPQNWQGNCAAPLKGYDNEIGLLSLSGEYKTLYRPEDGSFVGDVDLHWNADKLLFTMAGSHGRWQVWEMIFSDDGSYELRQATAGEEPDVDNYDACYLPDGRIIFDSTRVFQGIPCVGGNDAVANLFIMQADGSGVRQLCFDQDHNWCPAVLNNGRVLYSRWEYSDTPHYFSRLLFHMNPDGTNQMEYYGSNSYWPNSIFYARPIPGEPTKVVAIVSGHHGVPRMGELVVFDPAEGRKEADGAVVKIPGHGKTVEAPIVDQLVNNSWPKFLHPFPLDGDYFLVSCKPDSSTPWGIYLVDTFDNMLKLHDTPGYAVFEPVPLRQSPMPPVVPDKVRPDQDTAVVYLADIYRGEGLKGIPRGAVKKLRLYEFHYGYNKIGGHINIGVEGPWDVHRILGTVPVLQDGSAVFRVPANMPIAVQPLDKDGRALQVMRSWFAAMPGETLSCVGCHEKQNMAPPSMQTLAARQPAMNIEPWRGPARGFSWKRDVQPVLDKYCVTCHNGAGGGGKDFRAKEKNGWSGFTPSYLELHPYVRRPGPESDYHLQKPMEWHASTSELVQMLEKGHGRVDLDEEAWDRLTTWIDLNVPDHGTWGEDGPIPKNYHQRRIDMRTKYANRPEDPEVIPELNLPPAEPVEPRPKPERGEVPELAGWPMDEAAAKELQVKAGTARRTVDLGGGVTMDFVLIPAGEFVMGSANGPGDERPAHIVKIDKPFWMSVTEVTNAQYQRFDPAHHNGYLDQHHKDHTTPGYPIDAPDFPAVRLAWNEAVKFCEWVSEKLGERCSLPTEAEWEWACRAGTGTALNYGDVNADFAPYANLADVSIKLLAVTGVNPQPIKNPNKYQDFLPQDARFDDGCKIMTSVASYKPNAWGLHDMHGNAAEWTRSSYRAYPYSENDGRNGAANGDKKVARGGSWRDRPKRATSSYRLPYQPYQPVYNVGLRIVIN